MGCFIYLEFAMSSVDENNDSEDTGAGMSIAITAGRNR